MYTGLLHTHKLSVILFLLIYLIKTALLLTNKKESLQKFTAKIKIPEMIISFLFLLTGIMMITMKDYISNFQIFKLISVLAAIPLAIVGFKKSNKALAILSFALLIAAYGLAEMNKKRVQKIEVAKEIITNSAEANYDIKLHRSGLYQANCAMCHGDDGKKGLQKAADLSVSQLNETMMLDVIKNGKDRMPSYKNALNDAEIQAIIEHINTLK